MGHDEERGRTYSRRSWLKRLGAAGVAASALGSAPALADDGDGDDGRYDYQFDAVVNMVDAGADPTGEEPVDPLIHEHAGDNTLLYFPEGQYLLEGYRNYDPDAEGSFDPSLYRRYENFGLKGAGSGKSSFVAPQGQGSSGGYFDRLWFEVRYGRNILVEGFTLDITAERTGGRFQVVPTGGFVARDLRVKGVFDNADGPLLFWVLDPDAHGLVQNVRAPDGSHAPEGVGNATGMYVSQLSKGTITIRNCHVEGFSDNGLYASNPSDPAAVRVEGGLYRNNNISQVRLGTARSYVRNARVEVTDAIDTRYTVNMRGVRQADGSGVTVKNCDILMSADANSSGGIVSNHTSGELFVENTRVRTDAPFDSPAINMKGNDGSGYSGGLRAKNVSITGDAEGGRAVRIVDRDANAFRNVCVEQTGADRDGLLFRRSGGRIANAVLDVTGEPVVTEGDAEVETSRVRYEGSCPAPAPREG